jgi:hypothetical protein
VDPSRELTAGPDANVVFGFSFLAVWICIGVVTAYVMRRAGHEFGPLAVMGPVLGPLLIPLVLTIKRDKRRKPAVRVLWEGVPGGGPVDVVIGLVGSGQGAAVARRVIDALGSRVGRVTLVFALDYESVGSDDWRDAKASAAVELELAAALLADRCEPGRVLVGGRQSAILAFAQATGHDLVVMPDAERSLGWRGQGRPAAEVSLIAFPVQGTATAYNVGFGGSH